MPGERPRLLEPLLALRYLMYTTFPHTRVPDWQREGLLIPTRRTARDGRSHAPCDHHVILSGASRRRAQSKDPPHAERREPRAATPRAPGKGKAGDGNPGKRRPFAQTVHPATSSTPNCVSGDNLGVFSADYCRRMHSLTSALSPEAQFDVRAVVGCTV